MAKIKICGLSRPEDIRAANLYKPDYIGFVFAKSRRQVSPETAASLKAGLSPEILSVGVFVNADREEILRLCGVGEGAKKPVIDLIQLHGDEDEAYALWLKERTSVPIIKAVRVRNREQILAAEAYPSDFLLLDTYTKGNYGGSGLQFDWSLIPPLSKPYFLAGGITLSNIAEALSYGPYAVDVSSAAETGGYKDKEKMRLFVEAVRKF